MICFDHFYWLLQKHSKARGEKENVDTKEMPRKGDMPRKVWGKIGSTVIH